MKTDLVGIEKHLNQEVLTDTENKLKDSSNCTFKITFDNINNQINPILRTEAIETISYDIKTIAKKIGFWNIISL